MTQPPQGPLSEDPVFEPVGICHLCRHRRTVTTCDAFPGGIPVVILTGRWDHREAWPPGDGGIRFEPGVNNENT